MPRGARVSVFWNAVHLAGRLAYWASVKPGGIAARRRALAEAVDQDDHERQDEQHEQPQGGGQKEERGEPPRGAIAARQTGPESPQAALNRAMISARFGSVSVAAAPNSSGVSRSCAG